MRFTSITASLLLLASAPFVRGSLQEGPAENRIHNFRAVDVSGRKLIVAVDYIYAGDRGSEVDLVACPLLGDGSQVPGAFCTHEPMSPGSGTATIELEMMDGEDEASVSSFVEVCMYQHFETFVDGRRGEDFHCERFEHEKQWNPPAAPSCTIELISPEPGAVLRQKKEEQGKVSVNWRFSWSECPGADQYHLYVIGPTASNPLLDVAGLPGASYTFRDKSYGMTRLEGWTWKVRARIDGQWGAWSAPGTFGVSPPVEVHDHRQECSIQGQIQGLKQYARAVVLYTASPKKKVGSATVDEAGRYRFEKVRPGAYLVRPTGNFPGGKHAVAPVPAQRSVSCESGRSYNLVFAIADLEG